MVIITLQWIKEREVLTGCLVQISTRRQGEFPLILIFSYIPKDSELVRQSCINEGHFTYI